MDKVRLAIVGCGNISQLNVPGYLQHPHCEVYALCDPVPGRAEARARQWGITPKLYTDYCAGAPVASNSTRLPASMATAGAKLNLATKIASHFERLAVRTNLPTTDR